MLKRREGAAGLRGSGVGERQLRRGVKGTGARGDDGVQPCGGLARLAFKQRDAAQEVPRVMRRRRELQDAQQTRARGGEFAQTELDVAEAVEDFGAVWMLA